MGGRRLPPINLSEAEQAELVRLVRRQKAAQAVALRARIVLAASTGARTEDTAVELGVCAASVRKWHRRFVAKRVDGLYDEPRPGTPRTITEDQIERVVVKTLESTPEGRRTGVRRHGLLETGEVPQGVPTVVVRLAGGRAQAHRLGEAGVSLGQSAKLPQRIAQVV
jgi:transposase